MLLLPDEVLRFPIDQMLLIIRGQKVLKLRKMDYTEHPDAKCLKLEKTNEHIPNWCLEMETEKNQFRILEREMAERFDREEQKKEERSRSRTFDITGGAYEKICRKKRKADQPGDCI